MRTIKCKSGDIYHTKSGNKLFKIKKDTFIFQESIRVVKFRNGLDELVIIPWENIDNIRQNRN